MYRLSLSVLIMECVRIINVYVILVIMMISVLDYITTVLITVVVFIMVYVEMINATVDLVGKEQIVVYCLNARMTVH